MRERIISTIQHSTKQRPTIECREIQFPPLRIELPRRKEEAKVRKQETQPDQKSREKMEQGLSLTPATDVPLSMPFLELEDFPEAETISTEEDDDSSVESSPISLHVKENHAEEFSYKAPKKHVQFTQLQPMWSPPPRKPQKEAAWSLPSPSSLVEPLMSLSLSPSFLSSVLPDSSKDLFPDDKEKETSQVRSATAAMSKCLFGESKNKARDDEEQDPLSPFTRPSKNKARTSSSIRSTEDTTATTVSSSTTTSTSFLNHIVSQRDRERHRRRRIQKSSHRGQRQNLIVLPASSTLWENYPGYVGFCYNVLLSCETMVVALVRDLCCGGAILIVDEEDVRGAPAAVLRDDHEGAGSGSKFIPWSLEQTGRGLPLSLEEEDGGSTASQKKVKYVVQKESPTVISITEYEEGEDDPPKLTTISEGDSS
mmetsp:Transcript_39744/g.82630  ORF Transcript_39744/g.82630 Transcript_39744/m.82630 type:complete len:426 (-) Transcript_39744:273-1550(-)